MGFTALGRWRNAPPEALGYINEQITGNHGGTMRGRWHLTTKFYKSPRYPNKTISTITTGDSCYVMIEDISAPAHTPGEPPRVPVFDPLGNSSATANAPPHSRNNYVTFTPAQSFETFLVQLGGSWTSSRHPLSGVVVDGVEFVIGTDLIVRAGQVRQGQVHKGLLIEAELVPLPTSPNSGTPGILSELLLSLPPPNSDIQSVSLTDQQWEEVIYEYEDDPTSTPSAPPPQADSTEDSDLFCYRGEEGQAEPYDWTGSRRDKRMAFLILRLLVMEKST